MKLDLGSFAFGSFLSGGGGTPSWGTALGQGKGLKFSYPGWENIIAGMLYNSIPVAKVYMPIGKGGHIYSGLDDEGIQVAALFEKVYINEVRIPAPFIMVVYRDSSSSWEGRRTLKYSDKIEYRQDQETRIRNSDFIAVARESLQLADDACWLVSDVYIEDQDTLHMFAGIVNPMQYETFSTTEERKAAWIEAIKHTISESSIYKKYLSGETIKTYSNDMNNNEPRQVIYFGAPGTGKSHRIKLLIEDNKINEKTNVFRTTFHPDSDYSTFVGCYKPIKEERTRTEIINGKVSVVKNPDGTDAKESNITYTFIPQAFLKAYIKAYNSPEESVILVIEEINRGNCAQIFGDLFQLLDRKEDGTSEYPIKADDDVRRFLEEGKDEEGNDILVKKEGIANGELSLPSNLYIWATMNTSDQSLFPIDSAFKRRWEWKYIPIANAQKNYVIDVDGNQYDWWSFLDTINVLIEDATHSEDKKLGYFFAKTDNNIISVNTFVSKVIFYLWNDVFKDYESNHDAFIDENGNTLIFHKFFRSDGEVDTNVVITFLKKLGVDSFEVENPDEQGAIEVQPNNQRKKDHSRYSVNGFTNLNKALLTRKVLELYIKDHPSDDAATIVSSWSKLGLEKAVQHLLETEDMYNERTKASKDPNKRGVPFDLGNGEKVYLSTQFGIGNIDRFIEAINNANWNIRISKMPDQA
jgi:hypothetical protein